MSRIAKAIISSKAFLWVSVIFLIGSILVWLGCRIGLIAKGEPKVVLDLSCAALVFSAYGNIIISLVNKDNKGD